jgi:hypothetical protein
VNRIAWCSPWPPEAGDAAERSAAVVPELITRGFQVDVITNTHEASSYLANQGTHDLGVYHLANDPAHQFVWPLVFARPGMTVLHDGRLHRARSRMLLDAQRASDYRAEFVWNHPHVAPAIADLAIHGYDGSYTSQWPMVRAVIAASRLTVTHALGAIAELNGECPDRPVEYVAASQGQRSVPDATDEQQTRARLCATCQWPASVVIIATQSAPFEECRVPQILRAFADVRAHVPEARLLLAGRSGSDADAEDLIRTVGLEGLVHRADANDMTAADVVFCLRWPAALDMPGLWLKAIAARRATAILDLAHLATIPSLDPRTWQRHAPAHRSPEAEEAAVTVAIDVMDEDHSLRLALRRLAADGALRARLGQAGRAYWEAEHSPSRMADDYAHAIARALALPEPEVALPRHLRPVMS